MGEIPDCLDSCCYQTIRNLGSLCLWYGKSRDLDLILFYKAFQIVHGPDFNPADHQTDQLGIDIKHPFDHKTSPFKICIIGDCLSQISGSDDDQIVLLVDSQNLCNFRVQIFYIIAIALLSEAAEIIQILADLRSCNLHAVAQFIGRDTLHSFFNQLPQIAVIAGQSRNNRFRYFLAFHPVPPSPYMIQSNAFYYNRALKKCQITFRMFLKKICSYIILIGAYYAKNIEFMLKKEF